MTLYTSSVTSRWKQWLPETGIACLALFFAYRELGTFPVSWIDEGYFVMTARTLAAGHGYAIPILGKLWYFPYFLAVGPTVIAPAALSLKLFGLSLAAARLPMTFYIFGTCIVMYCFTKRIAGVTAARWSTLLLISLSAFVNTGKPVLGEVPAFFFLLLGISLMSTPENGKNQKTMRTIGAGAAFGLSVMTKLTFGLVYPALGILWCVALMTKQWRSVKSLTVILCVAVAVYAPWFLIEHSAGGKTISEIFSFVSSGTDNDTVFLNVLRTMPELLLRLPYIAFGIFLILGGRGLLQLKPLFRQSSTASKGMEWMLWYLIILLIGGFTLYTFNLYGWYRHLLPAHLLLLPFVPTGAAKIFGKKLAIAVLVSIAIAQGTWQFQHRGAGRGGALAETIRIVKQDFATTDLLIEQAEVFAQLPENPHWLFLMRERLSPTMTDALVIPETARCFARLRKLNESEIPAYEKTGKPVGSYWIVPSPEPGCPSRL